MSRPPGFPATTAPPRGRHARVRPWTYAGRRRDAVQAFVTVMGARVPDTVTGAEADAWGRCMAWLQAELDSHAPPAT